MSTSKQAILDYIRLTLCEKQPCNTKSGEDCNNCKLSEALGLINKMEDDACFAYELNLHPEYCELDCLACIKDHLMSLVPKYLTNADKIRQMTDEELMNILFCDRCCLCLNADHENCGEPGVCMDGTYRWLKERVD